MHTLTPLRRVILLVGGLVSLGFIAVAVLSLVDEMGRTTSNQDQAFAVAGKLVNIHNGPGSVEVVRSPDDQVHVHTTMEYGIVRPTYSVTSTPAGIQLESSCRGWLPFQHCDVHFRVQVPAGVTLRIDADAGDVDATGLAGDISLNSSAGEIRADRISGKLRMVSSAGDVVGTNLESSAVDAHSSAGDVDLTFASAPQHVTATSSAGDVDVALPRDIDPTAADLYVIAANAEAGDSTVDPTLQSGTSRRTVTATSSAGDVNVHRAPAG
jgi:Toastrack DUF4097